MRRFVAPLALGLAIGGMLVVDQYYFFTRLGVSLPDPPAVLCLANRRSGGAASMRSAEDPAIRLDEWETPRVYLETTPIMTMDGGQEEGGGQEHGEDAKCQQWCTPDGGRHEAPDGMKVVKCVGGDGSCAKMGAQCGEEHRQGCSEYCRKQCCSCCSL